MEDQADFGVPKRMGICFFLLIRIHHDAGFVASQADQVLTASDVVARVVDAQNGVLVYLILEFDCVDFGLRMFRLIAIVLLSFQSTKNMCLELESEILEPETIINDFKMEIG